MTSDDGVASTILEVGVQVPAIPADIVTKDMWEILFLLTMKVAPLDVKRGRNAEGKSESTFTFPASAKELLMSYLMNNVIPVKDFRDIKRAFEVFKSFTR